MRLMDLPEELLAYIAGLLGCSEDINALCLTCRKLYRISNVILYHHNVVVQKSSALSWAARKGRLGTVEQLLAAGANLGNDIAWPPLLQAIWAGHEDVALSLLHHPGIDPEPYSAAELPLAAAVRTGRHPVVLRLLNMHVLNVNCCGRPNDPWAPLVHACHLGYTEIVSLLLRRNDLDVNGLVKNKNRPLMRAARQGYADMVHLLLQDARIRPNEVCRTGKSALSYAASNGRASVVALLLADNRVCHDIKDNNGRSPLALAALKGREMVIRLLLVSDAVDPNSRDVQGQTPLSLAAERGHFKAVRALLADMAVDTRAADHRGVEPLVHAAQNHHLLAVKCFLRNHIYPDDRTVLAARLDARYTLSRAARELNRSKDKRTDLIPAEYTHTHNETHFPLSSMPRQNSVLDPLLEQGCLSRRLVSNRNPSLPPEATHVNK